MNFITMTNRIADNLSMLSSDGSTILTNSRVTKAQIQNKINDIYREELFPRLSDKFPDDFKQGTYPYPTYTSMGTASASSTSYSLIATSNVFSNSMEGFTVQNITNGTTAKIVTYVSATQVTLDTQINDTWDGATFYVLGNEFTFGGDTTDIKEIKAIYIKYYNTDKYFVKCPRIDYEQAIEYGSESFDRYSPKYYLTTINVNGTPTQAFGVLPFPLDYQGSIKLTYIQRPPALSADTDSPLISTPGISEVIINGVSAWGYYQMTKFGAGDRYQSLYQTGITSLIQNYKPKVRSNPTSLRTSFYSDALTRRSI